MNTLIYWIGFFWFCSLSGAATLDIYEALSLLKERSLSLKQAVLRVEKARNHLSMSESAKDLKIQFNTQYLKEDMPAVYLAHSVNERNLNLAAANLNRPGTHSHHKYGFEMGFSLWNPALEISEELAGLGLKMEKMSHKKRVRQLELVLVQTYFQAMKLNSRLNTYEGSHKRALKQLKRIEVHFQGGSALKTDLLSMQVREREYQLKIYETQNQLKKVLLALKELLDLPVDEPLDLTGGEVSYVPQSNRENLLKKALENRLDTQITGLSLESQKKELAKVKKEGRGRLDLVGSIENSQGEIQAFEGSTSWMAGIKYQFELFDSGLRKSKIKMKEKEARIQEIEAEKKNKAVEFEIQKSLDDLELANLRLKVNRERAESSKKNLESHQEKLEGGSLSVVDYLSVDEDTSLARSLARESLYEVFISRANLLHKLGEELIDFVKGASHEVR